MNQRQRLMTGTFADGHILIKFLLQVNDTSINDGEYKTGVKYASQTT